MNSVETYQRLRAVAAEFVASASAEDFSDKVAFLKLNEDWDELTSIIIAKQCAQNATGNAERDSANRLSLECSVPRCILEYRSLVAERAAKVAKVADVVKSSSMAEATKDSSTSKADEEKSSFVTSASTLTINPATTMPEPAEPVNERVPEKPIVSVLASVVHVQSPDLPASGLDMMEPQSKQQDKCRQWTAQIKADCPPEVDFASVTTYISVAKRIAAIEHRSRAGTTHQQLSLKTTSSHSSSKAILPETADNQPAVVGVGVLSISGVLNTFNQEPVAAHESEGAILAGSSDETARDQHVDAATADAIGRARRSRANTTKNAAAAVSRAATIEADQGLAIHKRFVAVVSSSRMWDPGGSYSTASRQ